MGMPIFQFEFSWHHADAATDTPKVMIIRAEVHAPDEAQALAVLHEQMLLVDEARFKRIGVFLKEVVFYDDGPPPQGGATGPH